jgi:hypothetical protein
MSMRATRTRSTANSARTARGVLGIEHDERLEYGPHPRGHQPAMFRSSIFTASTEAVTPYRSNPVFLASEYWRLAGHQVTQSGLSI